MFTERKSLLEAQLNFLKKFSHRVVPWDIFHYTALQKSLCCCSDSIAEIPLSSVPTFSQTLCCCYLVGAQRIYANKGFDDMLRNIKMHRRQQLLLGSLSVFMAISLLYRTQTVKLDTDPMVGFSIFNSTLTVIVKP